MSTLELTPHPRLYVPADTLDHLCYKLHSAFLRSHADPVVQDADRLVGTAPIREGQGLPSSAGATRCVRSVGGRRLLALLRRQRRRGA